MLLYGVKDGGIKPISQVNILNDYVVIGNIKDMDNIATTFSLDKRFAEELRKTTFPKLESYRDVDFIYIYDISSDMEKGSEYWIFLKKQGLVIICEDENKFRDRFIKVFEEKHLGKITVERILAVFLNQLIIDDVAIVRAIEEKVEDLEEKILISRPKAVNMEIVALKKRLLFLKHYYEQLLEVAWDIEENENGLISPEEMKIFGIFTGRLERITKSLVMLRDYLTQVREAQQAQEDIRLNETMEIFTVITAIFLPLTLLTSWYGMNFENMPELKWSYGYFSVFVMAIVIAVAMWSYFKKRNMFR